MKILNIEQIKFKKIRNLSDFLFRQRQMINIKEDFYFGNKIDNTYNMFYACANLATVPNFDTNNVINMGSMFKRCYNLTDIPNFDTSNVIDMTDMFNYCYRLTTIPNFNTSNVIDMSNMFYACTNLTTVPNFNTSNVTDMSNMFWYCSNLSNAPRFNTSNVANMCLMFYNCEKLIQTPYFSTSNVTNMSGMFDKCHNLKYHHSNYAIDNVTDMRYMFSNCWNLTTIDFDSCFVTNISTPQTDMSHMFYNCVNLHEINALVIKNLFNQAYNVANMFSYCNNLYYFTIRDIVYYLPNTSNLASASDYSLSYLGFSDKMIQTAITTYPEACNRAINNGWNISMTVNYNVLYKTDVNTTEWTAMPLNNLTPSDNAWAINNCFNANTPNKHTITNLKVNNLPEVTNLSNKFSKLLNLKNVEELNIPSVTNMYSTFNNCRNLTTVSNFNTSNVIDMSNMFEYCYNLTIIPNFNTINVKYMNGMFSFCNNLTAVPIFDTSKVTNTFQMFYACYNLTTIPNFNTSNVMNMGDMFASCHSLINVPNFDTSKVTNMYAMFDQCDNLITVPNFNTSNVMNMSYMFTSCHSLINVPQFNTSNVKYMWAVFAGCDSLTEVSNFNMNKVIDIYDMFTRCKNLSLSSCENILYSIPYYNNIIDKNKYPMLNYFANNSALTNNNMIANLNSAAINAAEEKGWFITPTIKIDYTLLDGTIGTNKISINGMNGLEQLSNLRNMMQSSSYALNQANKLIISGTSENLELAKLSWTDDYKILFKNLVDLDFVGINTASATNGCEAFNQSLYLTNLNGLKTNSIVMGSGMFRGCQNLNIQWNSWNFSNVQNAYAMFSLCNLTNLSATSLLMPNVVNMKNIFKECSGITNDTMQNIIKVIPDYTQLIDTFSPDNTLNYLGITNDQIDMLSDEYKQMAADKHWNVPGFVAREKVSILPICNNLGAISNYSGTTNEYPMEVIYDDTYGDYFLQSKNQGKQSSNSSAVINFTNELVALYGNKYYMDIYYSCENSWDYLQIFKMNNGSSSWSQIGENKYTGSSGMNYLHSSLNLENIQVGDQLRFTYYKDGSGDSGLDGCLISIYGYKTDGAYEITYSLVEEPEITKYKIIPKE